MRAACWAMGLIGLATWGCGSVYPPEDLAAGGPRGGVGTARGFAARCAGCHGAVGEGTTLAPPIQSPHEGYAAWVVRNGRTTQGSLDYPQDMPAFGDSIGPEELDEILTTLHQPPMPEDGQGLYVRFCANCHGPDGSGGRVAVELRGVAADAEDFIEEVREGNDAGEYGDRYDFMPARARGELRDEEVERIRSFLLGT